MARGIDERPYLEWLDGVESVAVSPSAPHGIVSTEFLYILRQQGGEIGAAFAQLHLRVDDAPRKRTLLLPDVAFYRFESLLALAPADRVMPNVPPDIAIEVRSPNDRPGFREEKIRRYLAWGCHLVLDADPATRRLRIHNAGGVRELGEDATFADDAVPWLSFEVRAVFARLARLGF
jgi:Uma2 family endonuclease